MHSNFIQILIEKNEGFCKKRPEMRLRIEKKYTNRFTKKIIGPKSRGV